jgi:hypothetical protein
MRSAVRFAGNRRCATKEEIGIGGIAHRPSACAVIQFEKRTALLQRNAGIAAWVIDIGLGVYHPVRQQLLLPGSDVRRRCSLSDVENFSRRLCGARATMWRRLADAEPVNLPEHGAAADAVAQFAGDLPGGRAFRPPGFQAFDAVARPRRRRA